VARRTPEHLQGRAAAPGLPDTTPAPGDLEKVRAFVNSRDVEQGTDELASPAALAAWLDDHGLASGGRVTKTDLSRSLELREALRGVLRSHVRHPAPPSAGSIDADSGPGSAAPHVATLRRIAAGLPTRLEIGQDGQAALAPGGTADGSAALARILLIAAEAATLGTWARLKVCGADDCLWAFYDRSPTRSGCWCSMKVCGSRAKSRAYRQRSAATAARANPGQRETPAKREPRPARTPASGRPTASRWARSAAPGA
jgi:predicted RNA-binding Zn ribbon-like protein